MLQLTDNLTEVHDALDKSRRMLILTGAGISCSTGIPDFRSSAGLYNTHQAGGLKGKDLFDVSVFQNPHHVAQFSKFMARLHTMSAYAQPTRTHRFISRQLHSKRAIRCYTQNIDGIEAKLGLKMNCKTSKWKELQCVQLHGDIHTLRCTQCSASASWDDDTMLSLQAGDLPECPSCVETKLLRQLSGKRTGGMTIGRLRPNIVLYGEEHPHGDVIACGLNADVNKLRPDLLVIVGTSLKVHGVKQLVRMAAHSVHARGGSVILINDTLLPSWSEVVDVHVQGPCDEFFALHEAFTQRLVSPPTTPEKKNRTRLLPLTRTKRTLADISNITTSTIGLGDHSHSEDREAKRFQRFHVVP